MKFRGMVMHLTDQEKRMIAGEQGEATRLSMELLVRIGEVYGAEEMASVRSVHAACVYPEFSVAVEIMERFADLGGKFRAVTTANPILNPINVSRWEDLPESRELQSASIRQINAIQRMGVIPNWSCTPYFQGNLPMFGEPISWVESSAIIFANSVLGARTNRTTMGVDLASAITGKVPNFGLLLSENRAGNALAYVEYRPKDLFDYGNIGFVMGKAFAGKVPVIEGLPMSTTANMMKVMGAAAAIKGGISLYHALGLTPEASSKKEVFDGRNPEFEIKIGAKEVKDATEEMNTFRGGKIDAVLVGCPHPSVEEIKEIALLLDGRKVMGDIKFCLFAGSDTISWSRHMGYVDILEKAGVRIFEGDCILFHSTREWGWKNVVTNSAKYACSLPSNPTYFDVLYTDLKGCVELSTR